MVRGLLEKKTENNWTTRLKAWRLVSKMIMPDKRLIQSQKRLKRTARLSSHLLSLTHLWINKFRKNQIKMACFLFQIKRKWKMKPQMSPSPLTQRPCSLLSLASIMNRSRTSSKCLHRKQTHQQVIHNSCLCYCSEQAKEHSNKSWSKISRPKSPRRTKKPLPLAHS